MQSGEGLGGLTSIQGRVHRLPVVRGGTPLGSGEGDHDHDGIGVWAPVAQSWLLPVSGLDPWSLGSSYVLAGILRVWGNGSGLGRGLRRWPLG